MTGQSTVHAICDIAEGTATAHALAGRAAILAQTQAAEEAVLRPRAPGRWPHDLRAALAARIARLNGEERLARHFLSHAGASADLADPADDGTALGLGTVIAFMDKVAANTRNVAAEDISALQAEGIDDADIVRLAELNAFLSYQIRVIAGVRLMQGGAA
jgi:uncharacterized protein YciW